MGTADQTNPRLTAAQIFSHAVQVGEDELKRSTAGLAFSGLGAGLAMGLSALGCAAVMGDSGRARPGWVVISLLYPLGFIAVIVGRAQLFTENTLFPVILVLDRRRHLATTARLWTVVLIFNVLGALCFAMLMILTSTLDPGTRADLEQLGVQAARGTWTHLFWAGIAGGWIIALVAWLVTACRFTISQIALIWLLTFVIGVAHLAHCIAGSTEILSSVIAGKLSAGSYFYWFSAAALGNAIGGVVIVSLLNWAQVVGTGRDRALAEKTLEEAERETAVFPRGHSKAA